MERFGPSLTQIINVFGKLPPKDVLSLGLQILDALKIMHEQGVVYNNLSLGHVLIGDFEFSKETRTMIKLIDFSKARIIKSEDGKPIKNDGVIYKDETEMVASFQKKSDIQSLERLMQELGLEIDLQVCDI